MDLDWFLQASQTTCPHPVLDIFWNICEILILSARRIPDLSVQSLFNVKGKIGAYHGSATFHDVWLTIVPSALVTGGGTGIGKTIASALVQNGAKVYIAARKESQLKEVRASVSQAQSKFQQSIGSGWA